MSHASDGTLWFLPIHHVFQPFWRSTSARKAFSIGMCPFDPGKPVAPSAMQA